jgi:hypothetical protein
VLEAASAHGGNARTLRLGEFLYDTGPHRFHDRDPEATRRVEGLLGAPPRARTALRALRRAGCSLWIGATRWYKPDQPPPTRLLAGASGGFRQQGEKWLVSGDVTLEIHSSEDGESTWFRCFGFPRRVHPRAEVVQRRLGMTLDERLTKLECENRLIRRCAAILIGAVAFLILAAQDGKKTLKEIEAKSLTLKDEAGRPRAALKMESDAPFLAMWDEAGNERVRLGGRNSSSLSLKDAGGRERLVLNVPHDGAPSVMLNDMGERYRLFLGVDAQGDPEVSLWDGEAKVRIALGVRLGMPRLLIADRTMRERAVLGIAAVGKGDTPEWTTESALTLFDADGRVIWQAK